VLAERLLVQHHSAVELVNRLEAKGLLRRARGANDRRSVLLMPTRRGEKLLRQLALTHRAELQTARSKLLQALTKLTGRDHLSGHVRGPARPRKAGTKRQTKQKRARDRK
jgi:DNA-binding MarR family transcriptional regulator